jgi:hypothetical protein
MHALIENGVVRDVIPPAETPLVERFHPDIVATCVEIPAGLGVAPRWTWSPAGGFAPPPGPDLPQLRAATKASAQHQLAARIAAGMPWSGRVLQIDEASQGRLSAAVLLSQYGLPSGFAWRMADNSALALDAAGLVAMAHAAGTYVAALRARYWAIADAVAAAPDAAALEAIDVTAAWPDPPTA